MMSHVEGYAAALAAEDQAYAACINFHYSSVHQEAARSDERMAAANIPHIPLNLLEVAVADAEDLLKPDAISDGKHPPEIVELCDQFGYGTTRQALNWCNYRSAYVRDLAVGYGVDPDGIDEHPQPPDELCEQYDDWVYMKDRVLEGDPLYVELCAQVEWDRVQASMNRNGAPDPVQLEENRAFALLLNRLDRFLVDGDSVTESEVHFTNELEENLSFAITRHREAHTDNRMYIVTVASVKVGGSKDIYAVYVLKESDKGIQQLGQGQRPGSDLKGRLDISTALTIAKQLAPHSQDFNFKRERSAPAQPPQTVRSQQS